MSLALLDIDHFKSVNDRFGHDVGDLVLTTFAEVLVATVRESDVVIRTGGEEFVVLMPSTPRAEGVLCCERVRAGATRPRMAGAGDRAGADIECRHRLARRAGDGP